MKSRRQRRVPFRAAAILSRIPLDRVVTAVEVGVWEGYLSHVLLREHPLLRLTMVDLWGDNLKPEYLATHDATTHFVRSTDAKWAAVAAKAAHAVAFAGYRVTILRMDSAAAAAGYKDGTFDLAFIDDDHSYQGCLQSISAWAPKVKPGGWLGGHDYGPNDRNHNAPLYGVTEAVHTFCRQTGLAFQLDKQTTWWVQFPAA